MTFLTFRVTDFWRGVDLVRKTTQTAYALLEARGSIPLPDVYWHVPDTGERVPVRANPRDRQFSITIDVADDDVNSKLSLLKRLVSGSKSQAVRSWNDRTVRPVYLEVSRPSDYNTTINRVKVGSITDSAGGTYSNDSLASNEARNVRVTLILEPEGRPRLPIRLKNWLVCDNAMEIDTNSDDIPDGWSVWAGAGSLGLEIVDSPALINKSWAVSYTAANTSARLTSGAIQAADVSSGDHFTGYVWARFPREDGDVTMTAGVRDSGTYQTQKTISLANSDMVHTTNAGVEWWRIPLQGTIDTGGNTDLTLEDTSISAASAVHVGATYLQINPESDNAYTNPVMHLDSNSDGVADGISKTGAGGTYTIDTSSYLVGKQSQKVVYSPAVTRFELETITAPVNSRVRGYFWMFNDSPTDDDGHYINIGDGSGNLFINTPVTLLTPSVTKTVNGDVWNRYDFDIYLVHAADLVVEIVPALGGTLYIDGIWGEVVTTDRQIKEGMPEYPLRPPDAFCSYSKAIHLRDDSAVSTSIVNHNYITLWGIPGDGWAHLSQTVTMDEPVTGDGFEYIMMSRHSDGGDGNITQPHYIEAETRTIATGSYTATDTADVSRIGGSYVDINGASSGSARFSYTPPDDKWWLVNRRVIGVCNADTSMTADVSLPVGYGTFSATGNASPGGVGIDPFWTRIWDLGFMNTKDAVKEKLLSESPPGLRSILIVSSDLGAGGDAFWDGFYFLPVEEQGFIVVSLSENDPPELYFDAQNKQVTRLDDIQPSSVFGDLWTVQPELATRVYYLGNYVDDERLDTTVEVEYEVYPQVEHLYGGDI